MKKKVWVLGSVLVVLLLAACNNPFFPEKKFKGGELEIDLEISGESKIGETLIVDTSEYENEAGTFTFQWQADGQDITGATDNNYNISGIDAGKVISCIVIFETDDGEIIEKVIEFPVKIPFTITIVTHGAVTGDSVSVVPNTGHEDDEITLNYTVIDTSFYNVLDFGGVGEVISGVTNAGTGTRTYTVNKEDADHGVITIIATFEHTDLELDPITFTDTRGHITLTYGDTFSNPITAAHNGTGNITYTSDSPDIVSVDNAGNITIHKVGEHVVIITAEKTADDVYAHASKSYTLTINPKLATIIGLTVNNKPYDGTINATFNNSNAEIDGIINNDVVTINYSNAAAVFESVSAGNNINIIFSGLSLAGADSGNYIFFQPEGFKANITKAPGAVVSAPIVSSNTNTSITINAVTPPGNSQIVEYNIYITNTAPAIGWQTGLTFNGLIPGKTYYIFARSASNNNYETGDASVSAPITLETFLLTVADITNPDITVINSGLTIYLNGEPDTGTITVKGVGSNPLDIEWWYNDEKLLEYVLEDDDAILTLSSTDYRYNMIGSKFITVIIKIDGKPYSKRITFTVEEWEE